MLWAVTLPSNIELLVYQPSTTGSVCSSLCFRDTHIQSSFTDLADVIHYWPMSLVQNIRIIWGEDISFNRTSSMSLMPMKARHLINLYESGIHPCTTRIRVNEQSPCSQFTQRRVMREMRGNSRLTTGK